MRLIDTHCHLDFEPLFEGADLVLKKAKECGVEGVINTGSSFRSSEKSVEMASTYSNVWATVGLHPHDTEAIIDFDDELERLELLAKSDKVVAIGECGLDYFNDQGLMTVSQKKAQKKLFKKQLEIASNLNLPLVFHVRDAWDDFFEIIESWKIENENYPRGVVHCFTGDKDEARRALDIGFYLGFTGFVTFEQAKFDHIRESVKIAPIDKILIETDAPFLAPEPYRGKINEPAYLVEVARKIAEIKRVTTEGVAKKTLVNAEKLFNLK